MNVGAIIFTVVLILVRVVFGFEKWGSVSVFSTDNAIVVVEILGVCGSASLMASSQVEFSSPFGCVLRDHNRRSTPKTSFNGYIHSCIPTTSENPNNHSQTIRSNNAADSSWLPSSVSSDSENSNHRKTQEDSWLPTHNLSESDGRKKENDVDNSWLPVYYNDSKKNNNSTAASEDDSSNHQKTENDIDYSWLPATFIVSKENKNNKQENFSSNNGIVKKQKNVDGWALAREVVFSCEQQIQNQEVLNKTSAASTREVSPCASESSVEIPNSGGVSSLLRRWRDLAEAKNSSKNANTSPASSRSNSVFTTIENNHNNNHPVSPPKGVSSEAGDADVIERFGSSSTIEDSFTDWEAEKTSPRPPSCPLPLLCTNAKDSKVTDAEREKIEKEKIRVADIIKKLSGEEELAAASAAGNCNETSPKFRTSSEHQQNGELKGLCAVKSSTRLLRGRQAFNDFLMLTELDRRREVEALAERKAVSKFAYRGRIQALLRVRFLRLGAEAKAEEKKHKRCVSKTFELNRLNIMDLRDRFSPVSEKGAAESRSHNREDVKNTRDVENSSTSSQVKDEMVAAESRTHIREDVKNTRHMENASTSGQVRHEMVVNTKRKSQELEAVTSNQLTKEEDHHQQTTKVRSPCKEVVDESQDVDSHHSSKSVQSKEDSHCEDVKQTSKVPDREDCREQDDQLIPAKTSLSGMEEKENDATQMPIDLEEQNSPDNMQALESCRDWISEYSQPQSDWDEQESYDMQFFDTNHDWISDIARPKSDWECMRQARYQEMLDPYANNGDIRQLLERKSVSSFLSSGLREKIDQLMVTRTQAQSRPVMDIRVEEEQTVREESESRNDKTTQVPAKEEEQRLEEEEEEEEEDQDDDSVGDEYEETGSRIERQFSEYSEFIDQSACSLQAQSPSLERSWSGHGDHEVIYDSHQMASPSQEHSLSSNPFSQNNTPQSSSFIHHPSIEMELIYDLRGHMERLHQEIMELRKSITSCVTMQVKMQRAIKWDVVTSLTQSVQKEGRELPNMVSGKSNCFVCYETRVDSVFYRCGHMCTCYKCALDLQCSSGKCPICEAPIVDVVRAHGRDR